MHELFVLGAGISGLAHACFARQAGIEDLLVLEAGTRPGGKVQTEWIDGYCCEWGPQGFLDNVPDTLDLAALLGLAGDLVRADDDAGDRFIMRDGRLRRVPLSPPAFLLSDVLTWSGKLRVFLEPFRGRGAEEESVREFATRRIGREAADVLVDAMVTGVWAGDPAVLSLPSTFPKMRAMESEHGSLVKAMLAKARARRREGGGEGAGPAGPGGVLTTFRAGMQQLTDAAAEHLGGRVRLDSPVESVEVVKGGGFSVVLAGGTTLAARRLSVALPPAATADVLGGLLREEAGAALRKIPAARIAVVMTGYRDQRPFKRPTRGFGYLVPGRERRQVLGSIFCDSTFPHEAPRGHTLLRTLLGGWRNGEIVDCDDAELVATVRRELAFALGGDPEPDFTHVIRHDYGIPQYTLGHADRLDAINASVNAVPGLTLVGNGYQGVAVNACIAAARQASEHLASGDH